MKTNTIQIDTEALQAACNQLARALTDAVEAIKKFLAELAKHCAKLMKDLERWINTAPVDDPIKLSIGRDLVRSHKAHWNKRMWIRAWLDKFIFGCKSPSAYFLSGDKYMWDYMRRTVKEAKQHE